MMTQNTLDDALIRAYVKTEVAKVKFQITQWVGGLLLAQSALIIILLLIFK